MGNYDIKQYILVCKGGWTHGKITSQVAHASLAVFSNQFDKTLDGVWLYRPSDDERIWLNTAFAKVILKASNKEQLKNGYRTAKLCHVNFAYIEDSGATQKDEEAATLAIGPFDTTNEEYKSLVDWLSQFKLY